ncbi:general stress protein [Fictibacillus iocasae]|uniref:General stress protein n=1 Tax=Fictibacillus iocasae TaxID=2715437 RepID=A0ABW2NQ86_9BACL
MKRHITGAYETEREAVSAIKEMIHRGYESQHISIVAKDDDTLSSIADQTHVIEKRVVEDDLDNATYGTIAGFLAGIGGGIAVPGLGVPGVGPLLAAGPFASMFTHDEKDFKEVLLEQDLSEEEAEKYTTALIDGKIIVMVDENHTPA